MGGGITERTHIVTFRNRAFVAFIPHKSYFTDPYILPEPRSCVKVEGAVLGSPSLIVLIVFVDVKQH